MAVTSANRYLDTKERYDNAKYIWDKLRAYGWATESVAGLLGNTHVESGHNPGIWEGLNPNDTSRGFGLVQYTPATMILEQATIQGKSPGDMDFQLDLIDTDAFGHWIPTDAYNFSYSEFKSNSVNLDEYELADAFLKNFERPANQNQPIRGSHAEYWLNAFSGSSSISDGPVIVENGGQIEKAIEWMVARQGKVYYSMANRNGPNSYDCSSAVFYALQHAGFPIPFIGNTETLYSMEGDLLLPISSSEKRRGDIFVSGTKGGSNNAYGHTGFCLNETQAIHCSSRFNGIGISSNSNSSVAAYGGAPVYWYRVAGSNIAEPRPNVTEEDDTIYITSVNGGKEYIENEILSSLFGRNMADVSFENVESAYDLLQKAKDYLNNQTLDLQSLSVTYAQLDKISDRYKNLKIGDVITVWNEELNVNTRMRIENKTFSLEDESVGSITLGKKVIYASDWLASPDLLVNLNTLGGI